MKTTVKKIILQGILLPSLVFVAYGVLCWATDPFGVVLTDIGIKIPAAFACLLLVRRIRPIEKKTMPKRYIAAMLAIFSIAVCVPAQLMTHAGAIIGDNMSGLEVFPKMLVTAPILEEIVYRGLIFGISRTVLGFWPATIVSAFWFQLAHLTADYAVITIPVAIATAGIYELTGNLKYNMLLHSVFNLIACFFINIHIPRITALPLYAVSIVLLVIAVIKRDSMGKMLRVSADSGHL